MHHISYGHSLHPSGLLDDRSINFDDFSRRWLNERGNSEVIQAWSDSLQISKTDTAAAAAASAEESSALGSTGETTKIFYVVQRRRLSTDIRNSDRRNDVIGDTDVRPPTSLPVAMAPESSSSARPAGSNATPTTGHERPGTYANLSPDNRSISNFV